MNGQGVYLSKHLRWHFADITPDKSNAEVSLTIEVLTYTLKTFALFLFKCIIILMALYYTTKLMLKAMANFINRHASKDQTTKKYIKPCSSHVVYGIISPITHNRKYDVYFRLRQDA